MAEILSRGETVYKCDVCKRAVRLPSNPLGMDVMLRCIITKNCRGSLHKTTNISEIANTPTITPSESGVEDWFQRTALFNFSQKIASSNWIINHNMGIVPAVEVFVNRENAETGKTVLTEITRYTITSTAFTTTIKFDVPESGVAQCLSLTSNVLPPTIITAAELSLLTHDGEITIATSNPTPAINVVMRYTDTNTGEFVDVTYNNVDNVPSTLSPWVGISRILLGRNTYFVRSFNIINTPGGNAFFQNTANLAGGRIVTFPTMNTQHNSNILLLGKAPFAAVDKLTTSYVDLASIANDSTSIVMSNSELYIQPTTYRSTYPPILPL